LNVSARKEWEPTRSYHGLPAATRTYREFIASNGLFTPNPARFITYV
jgi:hypothetical protein